MRNDVVFAEAGLTSYLLQSKLEQSGSIKHSQHYDRVLQFNLGHLLTLQTTKTH